MPGKHVPYTCGLRPETRSIAEADFKLLVLSPPKRWLQACASSKRFIYKAYLYLGYRLIGKQLLKSNIFSVQYGNKDQCKGHTEEKALVLFLYC